ncbi:MAG: hypothetical protein ACI9MR_002606 [Myxococcota bacterium]|jgi:hypothetical protein
MSVTQRLVCLAVNDGTLLTQFVERHFDTLDVTADADRGVWGIGYHGNGEMLVKRAPIHPRRPTFATQLGAARSHQVVLAAEHGTRSRHHEDIQPLRDRDWLFAMRGSDRLDDAFVERAQASLRDSAFRYKRGATVEEAVFTVVMHVLQHANVRDVREITTKSLREALIEAGETVRALATDTASLADVIVTLHVSGLVYALSFAAPVYLARYSGLGHPRPERPGRGRVTHPHFRAVVVSDRTIEESAAVEVEVRRGGCVVEVGLDGAFDVFG